MRTFTCPKCRNDLNTLVRYIRLDATPPGEYLTCKCPRCEYTWKEAVSQIRDTKGISVPYDYLVACDTCRSLTTLISSPDVDRAYDGTLKCSDPNCPGSLLPLC